MTTDSKVSDVQAREREAFEIWAGWPKSRAPRKPNGEYHAERDELRWKAWLARASQQPSAQWIACSERLPDAVGSYLVYGQLNEPGLYEIAWAFFNSNKDWCDTIGYFAERVERWMPLPEPPHSPDTAPNGEREWYPNHEADGHETGE